MKITEFRPSTESDFPKLKDKEIFEVLSPVQKTVKDLVKLTQKHIGTDNLNEVIIEVDLVPETWNTIEISGLNGYPKGACPILIDYTSGLITAFGCEIIDATHIKCRIDVSPSTTSELTTRILVKGS